MLNKKGEKMSNRLRSFSPSQKEIIYFMASGVCVKCGCELEGDFNADHIMPFSKGGLTIISNGQALCVSCNFNKRDKVPVHKMLNARRPLPCSLGVIAHFVKDGVLCAQVKSKGYSVQEYYGVNHRVCYLGKFTIAAKERYKSAISAGLIEPPSWSRASKWSCAKYYMKDKVEDLTVDLDPRYLWDDSFLPKYENPSNSIVSFFPGKKYSCLLDRDSGECVDVLIVKRTNKWLWALIEQKEIRFTIRLSGSNVERISRSNIGGKFIDVSASDEIKLPSQLCRPCMFGAMKLGASIDLKTDRKSSNNIDWNQANKWLRLARA